MRLRHLRVKQCPPLGDVAVRFSQEPMLEQLCAVNFVVGVNGCGKTRLLRALAQILMRLEALQTLPDFPCTLVYDIGHESDRRTIVIHQPDPEEDSEHDEAIFEYSHSGRRGADVAWLQRDDADWEDAIRAAYATDTPEKLGLNRYLSSGKDWPGSGEIGRFLPGNLLVYTSGAISPWLTMADDCRTTSDEASAEIDADEVTTEYAVTEEPSWDDEGESDERDISSSREDESSIAVIVAPDELRVATAVQMLAWQTLDAKATSEDGGTEESTDFGRVLQELDKPRIVQLTLVFDQELWKLDADAEETVGQIMPLAAAAHREIGTERLVLHFDVTRQQEQTDQQAQREAQHLSLLADLLSGNTKEPYRVFRQLCAWQRSGLLRDISFVIRKDAPEDAMLYDHLSDGERAFLGRMALFFLMESRQPDSPSTENGSLVILDEPETHFNDVWKRELVAMLCDVLSERPNQVLISTHSSIALTDVFDEEIRILRKTEGEIKAVNVSVTTFGADPGEIMMYVFDAKESVGRRSIQWLDQLLARHPWGEEDTERVKQTIDHIAPGYHRDQLRRLLKEQESSAS